MKEKLDSFFGINRLDKDPAFSRFLPMVYDPLQFRWQDKFEADFNHRFNGLMISGSQEVETIYLAVFPTDEVIRQFIEDASEGDLLFMHHPIPMECGDPRGNWGRGFVPIPTELIDRVIERKLSVYTCHAPLDYNREVGTSDAIAEALEAQIIDEFCKYGNGYAGLICKTRSTSTKELIARLLALFEIPYVDFEGKEHEEISRIAIIAGCGDVVSDMKYAASLGAQAYITGEIHCHIDNDYGRQRYRVMMDYVQETPMSLIGLSHAASEFFVMKTQMKRWLEKEVTSNIKLLRQRKWWF
ncbi:Nif3-like dinuclear metal center hexameric protein [Paenibacillus spongiae]|uniref:GTP cyclohydrolase 1 type 2 homolog n=2 Tax=Paenibacillus spongiae TaxID=2909671 RepID=A0ABY5SGM9_9BACL|nr:Nif3-like dinuclear metal center hexameric protein [Paenibacillus spongiae]UVI33146.1 Nif3-like dinuclear metal center hexameric protein [Paenibacillus spongiae]